MKYYLHSEERWPDFHLEAEHSGYSEGDIELTEAEYQEWMQVAEAYAKWQARFTEIYESE
jgi:hypothetical protein